MARRESVAVAGYYPMPEELVPDVLDRIVWPVHGSLAICDPCAGEGKVLQALCRHADRTKGLMMRAVPYACELEAGRYTALRSWCHESEALRGDAFLVQFEPATMSALFLNPPYDTDRDFVRLEHRFLTRFTDALKGGGLLVYVVPFYALSASASYLAQHYTDVGCYRFPGASFEAFQQVVLFGIRRSQIPLAPDAGIQELVERWSSNPKTIPSLRNNDCRQWTVSSNAQRYTGVTRWKMGSLDLEPIVRAYQPWMRSSKLGGLDLCPGVMPDELLTGATYPVATSPRPAHLAAAIAAGIYNGHRVDPDEPGRPSLLIKGTFLREYVCVDERFDEEGRKRSETQVQQPRLVVTALDLEQGSYETLEASPETTQSMTAAGMSTGDLLVHYGKDLLRVMQEQSPVLFDPARTQDMFALPPLRRSLYRAQGNAVRALVKLLGGPDVPMSRRQGKAAILLGELGSGKSSCALATAATIGAQRMLVLCPPILLTTWQDQARAVIDGVRVTVLTDPTAVESYAQDREPGLHVAILSRETAKLGHGYADAGSTCTACGAEVPKGAAKRRLRCEATYKTPVDVVARWAVVLARSVASLGGVEGQTKPDPNIESILCRRHTRRLVPKSVQVLPADIKAERLATARKRALVAVQSLARTLCKMGPKGDKSDKPTSPVIPRRAVSLCTVLARVMMAAYAPEHTADLLEAVCSMLAFSLVDPAQYGNGADLRSQLVHLLPLCGATTQERLDAMAQARSVLGHVAASNENTLKNWILDPTGAPEPFCEGIQWATKTVHGQQVLMNRGGHTPGTEDAVRHAFMVLVHSGRWEDSPACGEPLYQAVPEPRRVALAKYICRRHPHLFDFLVMDEIHEYASEDAAQSAAAQRLASLGKPMLCMTGSVMNGYAESMFNVLWMCSPKFRAEFTREDRTTFVDRYGYRKALVEYRDRDTGKIVEFGAVSDRVERTTKITGDAPGVLPLLLLRHLLPIAVTLHKADLALDLPSCTEEVVSVDCTDEQQNTYYALLSALSRQINADRFTPGLAGRLWGAMAELPSYLDRATSDVGNRDDGSFELAYPPEAGGMVVASAPGFDSGEMLPKESWLVSRVQSEISEGRNVLVFVWNLELAPRIVRLLTKALGNTVAHLEATRVSASKREAWINRHVLYPRAKVLVVNPACVQTGLNNLVHFSTAVWFQNPACNPLVYRQANGRIDRIGQTKPTRVVMPVYRKTVQEQAHKLLLHKVAVGLATDGLDAESALQAAGVGHDPSTSGIALGRQLYKMVMGE